MASIKVPPLGESIVEATISRWLKKEGDSVVPGDTLVELETDKITVEVPAMSAGVLTKRAHAEGDVVKVDELLAEIDESARSGGTRRRLRLPRAGASRPCSDRCAPAAPLHGSCCPRRHQRFARRRRRSGLPPRRASISRPFRARVAEASSASPT